MEAEHPTRGVVPSAAWALAMLGGEEDGVTFTAKAPMVLDVGMVEISAVAIVVETKIVTNGRVSRLCKHGSSASVVERVDCDASNSSANSSAAAF
jgi:hypothetical protein